MLTMLNLLLSVLAASPAHAFTYEDLVKLIRDQNVKSLEALLPLLPEDLRANYALMHTTQSLQDANPTAPRVILFGKDARLTLAFNGGGTADGGDTLELFQFRDRERTFDFREIRFPSARNRLSGAQFSASGVSADGRVSCTSCHSADPRPNWSPYSQWPGAYGSNDDFLNSGGEKENYARYVALRGSHPRYRWLVQDSRDATAPYLDAHDVYDTFHRPNLRLSDLLTAMTAMRDERLLETKLNRWQQLAFGFGGLHCELSAPQVERMKKANPAYDADIRMDSLFAKVGLSHHEWSPEPTDLQHYYEPWDHQGAFGFLAQQIAATQGLQLAAAGDEALKRSLGDYENRIRHDNASHPQQLEFFLQLHTIAPHMDNFGDSFVRNKEELCAGLTEGFVKEYERTHPAGP